MDLSSLIPNGYENEIARWIKEDIPSFDIAGFVVGEKTSKAVLLGKGEGIFAGKPFFTKIFELLQCKVEWLKEEGTRISPIENIAYVTGKANNILQGERLALNVVTQASGIATYANEIVSLAQKNGFKGTIAGTRKTTPGFRLVEKYALLVGGADTHRMDLSSMVMLKDNHIASAGSISKAVAKAKNITSVWYKIEVECQSYAEAEEAILAGAEIVMLDNFKPDQAKETGQKLKEKYPNAIVELSGGINISNIVNYLSPDIDIISMSGLITKAQPIDLSLKIVI